MPFTLPREARRLAEEIIKKSRFIARLRHVDDDDDVDRFLAEVRETERGAGHHCFAYVIGDEESTRIERHSDDGEPGGTAGAPILSALRSRDLVNVAAVASRYYGGVNLGTGGLARAYSGTVLAALEGVAVRPRVRSQLFRLAVDHATAGWVEAELRGRGFDVQHVDYGAQAVLTLACGDPAQLRETVAAITAGGAEPIPAGHLWR